MQSILTIFFLPYGLSRHFCTVIIYSHVLKYKCGCPVKEFNSWYEKAQIKKLHSINAITVHLAFIWLNLCQRHEKVEYVFSRFVCVCVCIHPHARGGAGGHNVLWLPRRRTVRLCMWERANASHAVGGLCAFWLQCEDRQRSRWRSGGGEWVWGVGDCG